MSGSVESGRPTPIRTRMEVRARRARACSDFRPLWPARPPPTRVRMSPNGRSISSCSTSTRSSGDLQRAARGPDGAPRPRSCTSAAGASRRAGRRCPRRPSVHSPRYFVFGLRQVPPRGRGRSRRRSRCCGASRRTSVPGLPSPTISQSTGADPPRHCTRAATRRGVARVGRLLGVRGCLLVALALADDARLLLDGLLGVLLGLDVDVRRRQGHQRRLLEVVEQRRSPLGAASDDRYSVSLIFHLRDVERDPSRGCRSAAPRR